VELATGGLTGDVQLWKGTETDKDEESEC